MNTLKDLHTAFFYIIQLTWGLPQTLCGFVLYACNYGRDHKPYRCAIATQWRSSGGISLGLFIFAGSDALLSHEYGHSLQSLILGPLYLIVVGIPSFIWANLPAFRTYRRKKKKPYSSLYCEKWADRLGNGISRNRVAE